MVYPVQKRHYYRYECHQHECGLNHICPNDSLESTTVGIKKQQKYEKKCYEREVPTQPGMEHKNYYEDSHTCSQKSGKEEEE